VEQGLELADQIAAVVRRIYKGEAVALHRPFITDVDARAVADVAQHDPVGYGSISYLEECIADRLGVKHAIAVSSGTAALHLALLAHGVDRNSHVCVPPLTFAAAAAAVTYCGATPQFTEPMSHDIKIGVDLLGFQCEGHLPEIEDAAEALGSVGVDGVPCGAWGEIGVLSFNNNKIVTSGGGGMVVTDDGEKAEFVRHLATTAKIKSPFLFEHDKVGYNYRMGNLAAALAIPQVQRLNNTLLQKREIHAIYRNGFASIKGVTLLEGQPGEMPNYWLNAIEVPPEHRDTIMAELQSRGIGCRALFTPLPLLQPYRGALFSGKLMAAASSAFARTILLPSGRP